MNIVNIAVQIIPIVESSRVYSIVDEAIDFIAQSGLNYQVSPFETIIEGEFDELMEVIKGAQKACYNAGAEELITNIKIHSHKTKDVFTAEKMLKY